jgi:hypothetical protein
VNDPIERQEVALTPSKKDPFEDKADDISQVPEVLV